MLTEDTAPERWLAPLIVRPAKKAIQVEVVLASSFDSLVRAYQELRDEHQRAIGNNQVLRTRAEDYWKHLMRIMSAHKIDASELVPP